MRKNSFLKTCFVTAALLATATASQASPAGVRIGTLTCDVAHGWGHVVTSSRQLNCLYHPRHRAPERYTGTLSKYGVDLGYTRSGSMIWEVIAPTSNVGRGALEGRYAGASANATVGLGVGANVLLGGFDRSVALQPLSVEGNTGLDVAAGVGVLRLRSA